jgi:uncharacterized protein
MVARPIWTGRIAAAHRRAPIVWLTGVRRIGKTTLVHDLPDALYLDCDLPSVAERVADPEQFLASVTAPLLVMDEVHQLADPSRLLKIAADTRPDLRVIATGSSTLAATSKFRDSLTGRKRTVHLVPVLLEELSAFGAPDLERRLRHGGLPPALLADRPPADFFAEWMDSFYARDVQELFRIEKRNAFLLLLELLLRQSGGLIGATSLARAAGVSRPTVMNWLEVLQVTHAITLLRPYHDGGKQELTHQPKAYGFDTGFVTWVHGWNELHAQDRGLLWEHVTLETLLSLGGDRPIQFWRDKQKREVDFVIATGRAACDAFECKWNIRSFDPRGLAAMREAHPKGRNFLVAPIAGEPRERRYRDLTVTVLRPEHLRSTLA